MLHSLSVSSSILDQIGNTPMIELGNIVPTGCARILLKIEADNPTGSMKDRAALAIVNAAEQDGRLRPGMHVVDYTGGSAGISLAMICAVRGYRLSLVTSDAFSIEKRRHMAALGAELTIVPSVDGGMDAKLTRTMVKTARDLAERNDAFFVDQLSNSDQLTGYVGMGEEIWRQTGGRIDAFVQMTGTTASVQGVSRRLKQENSDIYCVAVEPSESPVLSGGKSGTHKIEGVGAGYVVPLWQGECVDEIAAVSTETAIAAARELAVKEGIVAGTSTGGNVATAIELGQRLGPDATIVTLMCDSGVKYLSTRQFSN